MYKAREIHPCFVLQDFTNTIIFTPQVNMMSVQMLPGSSAGSGDTVTYTEAAKDNMQLLEEKAAEMSFGE